MSLTSHQSICPITVKSSEYILQLSLRLKCPPRYRGSLRAANEAAFVRTCSSIEWLYCTKRHTQIRYVGCGIVNYKVYHRPSKSQEAEACLTLRSTPTAHAPSSRQPSERSKRLSAGRADLCLCLYHIFVLPTLLRAIQRIEQNHIRCTPSQKTRSI